MDVSDKRRGDGSGGQRLRKQVPRIWAARARIAATASQHGQQCCVCGLVRCGAQPGRCVGSDQRRHVIRGHKSTGDAPDAAQAYRDVIVVKKRRQRGGDVQIHAKLHALQRAIFSRKGRRVAFHISGAAIVVTS